MSRPPSVLDGRYAHEWSGKLPRAQPKKFAHPPLHLCKCGQSQEQCVSCGAWFCEAPGHLKHTCESKGATP